MIPVTVSVSIETRPGLKQEKIEEALAEAEAIVSASDQVDSYMLRYNGDKAAGSVPI